MASFFNFGAQPVDVEVKLQGEEERRQVEVKGDKDKKEMCPVYYDGESVTGQVSSAWWRLHRLSALRPASMSRKLGPREQH